MHTRWFSLSPSLPSQEAPETLWALQEPGPLVMVIPCVSKVPGRLLLILGTQVSNDLGKDPHLRDV